MLAIPQHPLNSRSPNTWATENLGQFDQHTGRNNKAQELACYYHARTEMYDQSVCTSRHPVTGVSMPSNSHESGLINKYAKGIMEHTIEKASYAGITPREMRRAISRYSSMISQTKASTEYIISGSGLSKQQRPGNPRIT